MLKENGLENDFNCETSDIYYKKELICYNIQKKVLIWELFITEVKNTI